MFKIGDYVTRNSYNNDVVFKVIKINEKMCLIKGLNVRLLADAPEEDLLLADKSRCEIDDNEFDCQDFNTFRSDYFYIPGKVLHLDSDSDYLERCIRYYKKNKVPFVAKQVSEKNSSKIIKELLLEHNPKIVVITGHDAYYKKKIGKMDSYKNSEHFIESVKESRKYEKNNENLIIIAGACQSNYEALIKNGANFASSPKKINIHALDPAIIATNISLSVRNKTIDLIELLNKTKFGIDGMGGIETKGVMYVGYPKN